MYPGFPRSGAGLECFHVYADLYKSYSIT